VLKGGRKIKLSKTDYMQLALSKAQLDAHFTGKLLTEAEMVKIVEQAAEAWDQDKEEEELSEKSE
jgi:hypothetical protein